MAKTIYSPRHERFRELLKAQRKAKGLTQTVVAQRLGKPPSFVAKLEGGERRLDVIEFLDVADAIGFDPSRFIRALRDSVARAKPVPATLERRSRRSFTKK